MRSSRRISISIVIVSMLVCGSALAGQLEVRPVKVGVNAVTGNGAYNWWHNERARRQAELDAYLEANASDLDSFLYAPMAATGTPAIVFRVLPELFPEIWGAPEEKLASVGLGPDPWDPSRILPLGISFVPDLKNTIDMPPFGTVALNAVNFTCSTCHVGRVVDGDGTTLPIIAAPSLFNVGSYQKNLFNSVNHPDFTAANIQAVLYGKPPGWLYGADHVSQEVLDRTVFLAKGPEILQGLKTAINTAVALRAQTLSAYTYNVPNPPTPMAGMIDVLGSGAIVGLDPSTMSPEEIEAALPPAPAPSDIMATWRQDDRVAAQWDNSLPVLTYRLIGSSLSAGINALDWINFDNIAAQVHFIPYLPAAPYPFDVKRSSAARGARVFRQACAGCHQPGSDALYPPEVTGTDAGRADVITDFSAATLLGIFRSQCLDPDLCLDENGEAYSDDELLQNTRAYTALPLTGIWATAPFLHNGSVPTLNHLLAGERPDTFYRGNMTYDQDLVGFTWDQADNPNAILYDTSQAGYSNAGHDGPEFNGGIDWDAEPRKLWDLLEYLKTL